MHESSFQLMKHFRDKYLLSPHPAQKLEVYDFGSQTIGNKRSYRELFERDGWKYYGVDMVDGPNVDIVLGSGITNESADVIISGQMLEHCKYPWEMIENMGFGLKKGGLLCVIAPSAGPEHKYPVDCYRFLPDGMRAMAELAGLTVLETYISTKKFEANDGSAKWQDCVLVARKP